LNDTLVMLNSKLGGGIEVNRAYANEVARIQGYGSEINQVWTSLIDNAITAMGDEGALELKAYQEGDWVVVEVADNGPGIPVEIQDKIFDPFYTTKAPGDGAGLGLNLSHGIVVEKHQGEISFDSRPGETRFRVKLPVSDSQLEDRSANEASKTAQPRGQR
jgi:signal transduction histidine kinase